MTSDIVQKFIKDNLGKEVDSITQIPQSGSARQNYIVTVQAERYIVTYNPNMLENEAFYYFSETFEKLKLNTPKIHTISDDRLLYIQDFLGEKTLSQYIESNGLTEETKVLVKKSLTALFQLQKHTQNVIDYSKTFEYEAYDELPVLHDLYYFKNFLIDVLELEYHKSSLLKEFKTLTQRIENLQPRGIMIRDFQSRNIMVNHGEVFFIDYQGAMEGPLMYDVVSFLYQAKANFPEEFKNEMVQYYLQQWEDTVIQKQLTESLPYLKLIRFMQVLGAYGFRGLIQRKAHFLASLNLGIDNLTAFIQNWEEANNYPELQKLIERLKRDSVQEKINNLINNA